MKDNNIATKTLLNKLQTAKSNSEKLFAVLMDPDKTDVDQIPNKKMSFQQEEIDVFLVGGSLMNQPAIGPFVKALKQEFVQPVFLFPGSPVQFTPEADGLLFLSLISGRNADLLIGRHIEIAPVLKASSCQVLPTGYMLVNDGRPTSASYISGTFPIPSHKADIACATAQAGELLGLQCIYMDAGSGADAHIPIETIQQVAQGIDIPLIVGGGIRTLEERQAVWEAGADMIVVGTALE